MKNIILGICLVIISSYHAYAFRPDTEIQKEESRISFNSDWSFARFGPMPDGSKKAEPLDLEYPNTDDASWRKLDLPHDWGIDENIKITAY